MVVPDTQLALTELGALARQRLGGHILGITGSVGKTTTKDLVGHCLASTFRTTASARSLNNELGVPLTLCNAPEDAEWVVLEMGARGIGHIAELVALTRPKVGIVTGSPRPRASWCPTSRRPGWPSSMPTTSGWSACASCVRVWC